MELKQEKQLKGQELVKAINESAIKLQEAQNNEEYYNPFPIDVFPKAIQEIVNALENELNFPKDYTASSIIFACSVVVGNKCRINVKGAWKDKAIFFLALVGYAGSNKSHPLKAIISPLVEQDHLRFQEYKIMEKEFKAEMDKYALLNKKEKQTAEKPTPPKRFQRLLQDFTTEVITPIHENNPNGLGIYVDELATWIQNFNRYNKGADEQFWLSAWNGSSLQVDRKTAGSYFVKDCFISVIGTIQPDVVASLMKDRTANGFVSRILFAYPDDLSKKKIQDSYLPPDYFENWERILNKLIGLPYTADEPLILPFDKAGKRAYYAFQHENTDKVNELQDEGNSLESGILSKFDTHTARLALILEMIYYACGESDLQAVTERSVKSAITLTKYFQNTALRCAKLLNPKTKPKAMLATNKKLLLDNLPNEFTTDEAIRIGQRFKISESSIKRFLKNYNFFERIQQGRYKKIND